MPKKSVQFNPVDTVYTTYSSEEYDRSRFASITFTPFTFNFNNTQHPVNNCTVNTTTPRPMIKHLDLSSISVKEKPKLSINTSSLTPLFFTSLSTHYKYKEEEEEYATPTMIHSF